MSITLGVSENTTRCKGRKLGNQNLGDKEKLIDEVSRSILGKFTPTSKHKDCSLWLFFFVCDLCWRGSSSLKGLKDSPCHFLTFSRESGLFSGSSGGQVLDFF